ncbi:hypothetical protein ACWGKS_22575, partial [Nocardiopsis sp. NPDC055879]
MGTQSNEFEKLELFYAPLEETAQANLPSMAGTQENKDSAKSSAGKTDGRCLTKIVIAADHTEVISASLLLDIGQRQRGLHDHPDLGRAHRGV